MFEIKNTSALPLEIIERVDQSDPGCRISEPSAPIIVPPHSSVVYMGHEPGRWIQVRPA